MYVSPHPMLLGCYSKRTLMTDVGGGQDLLTLSQLDLLELGIPLCDIVAARNAARAVAMPRAQTVRYLTSLELAHATSRANMHTWR